MSTAIAIGTWRPPSRRMLWRNLAILGATLVAHALALLVLASGAPWMPQLVEPPVIEAQLLDAPSPARAPERSSSASERPRPAARLRAPPRVSAAAPPTAEPNSQPAIIAPPGFTARKLVEQDDATRESLRGSLGCRHEKFVALTKAEKTACAETAGECSRKAPLYAVIDPDKKAAFDGDCAKDDDWCLYRVGKGPYPGLFALGRKKKRKGWDD